MRIDEDMKLDYKDVLIRPKRSTLGSRKEVDLERSFIFRNYKSENDKHFQGVPIMASNMDGVGTFEMADVLATGKIFSCLVKTYEAEELIEYFGDNTPERTEYVAMSIGITDFDHAKFRKVYEAVGKQLKYVCIDVANGYSTRFRDVVAEFRSLYSQVVIIAGNVVTGEMTEELILAGADIIKVGIGPGSVCTTRTTARSKTSRPASTTSRSSRRWTRSRRRRSCTATRRSRGRSWTSPDSCAFLLSRVAGVLRVIYIMTYLSGLR